MNFHLPTAQIFIPDGSVPEDALKRTTHLAVGAHPDDLEIMAASPILECFNHESAWFSGVVLTDGRGSPRDGVYKEYTDEQMRLIRFEEQKKAAIVGEYAALVLLDYPSKVIKHASSSQPVEDIVQILKASRPQYVFTHNLADKHDTHVATALKVIAAVRALPGGERPRKCYGCEVWRDLDWMQDADKVSFDLSQDENLQAALLGIYDSQIAGGKRYDLASMARRRANATFFESHGVDRTTGLSYAMDLTPLILSPEVDITSFVLEHVQRFMDDVEERLTRLS